MVKQVHQARTKPAPFRRACGPDTANPSLKSGWENCFGETYGEWQDRIKGQPQQDLGKVFVRPPSMARGLFSARERNKGLGPRFFQLPDPSIQFINIKRRGAWTGEVDLHCSYRLDAKLLNYMAGGKTEMWNAVGQTVARQVIDFLMHEASAGRFSQP